MSALLLESTERGVHLEPEDLQKAGLTPGGRMELVELPDSETVVCRALNFAITKLGYAIGVSDPVWNGKEWSVDLIGADEAETKLGVVVLDARGNVVPQKSATFDSVMERSRAASAVR